MALGLVSVKVSGVVPPTGIEGAPNALLIVGGMIATTTTVAVAGFRLGGASVEVSVELVFTFTPAVRPVTLKVKLQELLARSVPEMKVNNVVVELVENALQLETGVPKT